MRVNYKTIAYCVTITFLLTTGAYAAEDDYIIGKEEDKTLLTLSIVFLAVCAIFLLVSIVGALAIIQKVRFSGAGRSSEYRLEEGEERYQSMYAGKSNGGDYDAPTSYHYEQLQLRGSSNGLYQSIDSSTSNGEAKTEQVTPPGTEKGQKDSRENEKHKTLSSFQNPAYESSMPYGLDKEVDFHPASEDHSDDTAL